MKKKMRIIYPSVPSGKEARKIRKYQLDAKKRRLENHFLQSLCNILYILQYEEVVKIVFLRSLNTIIRHLANLQKELRNYRAKEGETLSMRHCYGAMIEVMNIENRSCFGKHRDMVVAEISERKEKTKDEILFDAWLGTINLQCLIMEMGMEISRSKNAGVLFTWHKEVAEIMCEIYDNVSALVSCGR